MTAAAAAAARTNSHSFHGFLCYTVDREPHASFSLWQDPLKKASPGGSTGSDHSHSGGSGSLESSESASDFPCASPYGWSIAR